MASAFDPPQPTEPQARPAVAPQGARTDGRVAAADYARRQIATTYERPAVAHRQPSIIAPGNHIISSTTSATTRLNSSQKRQRHSLPPCPLPRNKTLSPASQ
jgi:hypothetical protein